MTPTQLRVLGNGWSGPNYPRSIERLVQYYRMSGLVRRSISPIITSVTASPHRV
jgi:hypothetical protein